MNLTIVITLLILAVNLVPLFVQVVCPYLTVGAGGLFDCFKLPVSAGAMFRISEHVGAQVELGYTFTSSDYTNDSRLSVGIGLCAFGKKVAVSVLNDFVE